MKADTITTLVAGDTHFPFQDDAAIDVFMRVVDFVRPQRIILNGDIPDVYALSRFSKDPTKALEIQQEIDMTTDFLGKVRAAAKKSCQIDWVLGNHEMRYIKYMQDEAPALTYMRNMTFEEIYKTGDYNINVVRPSGSKGAFTKVGLVSVGHFDKVSKHSGRTAQQLVEERFETVVQGHVHRLGEFYKTTPNGTFAGYEGGCLCDSDPEYIADPNWQQGFTVIEQMKDRNRFFVQTVPIIGGECLYNGHLF